MRQSRTSTVADGLLALILDGTYPPGGALPSEPDLATRFGVSRLTVREAIRSLASTKVIEVRQGKSSVVNGPDKWSPLDPRLLRARARMSGQSLLEPGKLLEARRIVEVGVAELAASRRTDEHLRQLSRHLEAMRQAHLHRNVTRFVEADLAFHDTLFQAVDNIFLTAIFEPFTLVLRTMRTTTSSISQFRKHAIDGHIRILGAVAEGEPGLARETMRAHLVQTEDDSAHYLGRRTGPRRVQPPR